MTNQIYEIDGNRGEGGGQVLRTSLSLSALTGRAIRLTDIRAGRSRPGLRPQHLTAVHAVAAVCDARLEGDHIDSQALTFAPQSAPQAGEYAYDVEDVALHGSAGSATLILQAVLWPLLFAGAPSQVSLRGGTHVPFSPPYEYVEHVVRPALARFGAHVDLELRAWGWLPAGKGQVQATVRPLRNLEPVTFTPARRQPVEGLAAVTNLPSHIPHRMARRATNLLEEAGLKASIQPLRERGVGPGAGICLWLPQAGFSSLGREGLPAEKVAEAAVAELLAFVDNEAAAVDHHLADQLLIPMALAGGRSTFTTHQLSSHTMTSAALLREWLGVDVSIEGHEGEAGRVTVDGAGFTHS